VVEQVLVCEEYSGFELLEAVFVVKAKPVATIHDSSAVVLYSSLAFRLALKKMT